MNNPYAVIIAARMGSQRLPGKALAVYCPDGETTNLEQVVRRWQKHSRRNPVVAVMTTLQSEDDQIESVCKRIGVACHRGPVDDPLSNMDGAVKAFCPGAEVVARGLADNPLVDVTLADWRYDVLERTGAEGLHYGEDHTPITYAGTTDVWSRSAWDRIVAESAGEQRLNPGQYYWDNLSKFSAVQIPFPPKEYCVPGIRTELDTQEDLEMLRKVWAAPYSQNWGADYPVWPALPTLWALEYLADHPEFAKINAHVEVKTQSKPTWKKGMGWYCENCKDRVGAIVSGDLEVRCTGCGQPKKFYARAPEKRRQ